MERSRPLLPALSLLLSSSRLVSLTFISVVSPVFVLEITPPFGFVSPLSLPPLSRTGLSLSVCAITCTMTATHVSFAATIITLTFTLHPNTNTNAQRDRKPPQPSYPVQYLCFRYSMSMRVFLIGSVEMDPDLTKQAHWGGYAGESESEAKAHCFIESHHENNTEQKRDPAPETQEHRTKEPPLFLVARASLSITLIRAVQ